MEYYLAPLAVIVSLCCFLTLRALKQRHLPPGPPGYPIIGNIFDVENHSEWTQLTGIVADSDIISLNMAGNPVIVLNSLEAAQDLLEKRSAIYSDRSTVADKNVRSGMSYHFGFMRYDEQWKEHRKLFKQEFQPPMLEDHKPCILRAIRKMLTRLLESPEEYDHHLRHMNGMIVLSTAYGIEVQNDNDPYVAMGEKTLQTMARTGNSTEYLVEYLPILKYLPEWFPGGKFKRLANEWSKSVRALPRKPMDAVHKNMANGAAKPCVATRVLGAMDLESGKPDLHQSTVLQNVLGSMYAASTDTTVSALESFILGMLRNPESQKKAQEAVDKVVGHDQLPDLSHIGSIPYVEAVVKETLRWNPVTPLAVPHRVLVDDDYRGYHIPAGAVVVGNA
ncbi:hypothetical protein V5O48_004453, partial [Marasmius crinis-equi]